MSYWVPGFKIQEGPEVTGIPLHYVAERESDGVPVWIRVDGHVADESAGALALAVTYEATSRLDHPELPLVLAFGSTEITGRPFLAFQFDRVARPRMIAPAEAAEEATDLAARLAEVHWLALECGYGGVFIPVHELDRIRKGYAVEGRRLPIWEFLAEPRRNDGLCGFLGALPEDEWAPFTAPELFVRQRHKTSIRPAVVYRLALQLDYILHGTHRAAAPAPGDAPALDPGTPLAGDTELDRLVRAALQQSPARRPGLEKFLTLKNAAQNRGDRTAN
ncbi:MAG: hypothetical protein ABIT01_18185 [Thermoanaerobaculia bacterium]